MKYSALIILIALFQYLFFTGRVGLAREENTVSMRRVQPAMRLLRGCTVCSRTRWSNWLSSSPP